jgi:prepilin-type N-terminal cleavage/methylation domain
MNSEDGRSSFILHRSSFLPANRSRTRRQRGFTLIELIVVVTIIGILAAVAVSNVKWAQTKAREAALHHDLFEMRKSIDDYYADNQKYPESLQTLSQKHYLRNIPNDPMTGKADWEEVQNTPDPSDPNAMPTDPSAQADNTAPGIYDVHSQAPGNGLDGKAYKTW